MKGLRVGALLLLSTPGWAAYQYYFTDNLTSVNAANWNTTGNVGASSLGLAASESAGGTLISRIPIPDGTYEAEVRTTLKLTSSGGTYTSYLQASADAATSGSGSGTYLAFEMQNPQFDSNGGCAASFLVLQRRGEWFRCSPALQDPAATAWCCAWRCMATSCWSGRTRIRQWSSWA